MNYICTWLCADLITEENVYAFNGGKNQDIDWRCLLLFYATSKRFNKSQKHLLFTNVAQLPVIDRNEVSAMLDDLDVEVIRIESKHNTPAGDHNFSQVHFYKFSVLEYISKNHKNLDDHYMILDSDCLFTRSVESLFEEARPKGFISFEDTSKTNPFDPELSGVDLKSLYEDFSGETLNKTPTCHLKEFFLGNVNTIIILYDGLLKLWPELIRRSEAGLANFKDEGQSLSYLYYKNHFVPSKRTDLIKQIWTNPVFYRNVERSDVDVAIWHLPAEKTFGLVRLYNVLIKNSLDYSLSLPNNDYQNMLHKTLGIPYLSMQIRLRYYLFKYLKV